MAFIKDSEFLFLAHRRLPRGWRFFPFDLDPNEAIARLECRLGYRGEGGLAAALCIRQTPDTDGSIIVNYLDGEALAMRTLLNHALCLYAGKTMETMVPIHLGQHAASLDVFREAGFKSWSDFKPDVIAYEMVL